MEDLIGSSNLGSFLHKLHHDEDDAYYYVPEHGNICAVTLQKAFKVNVTQGISCRLTELFLTKSSHKFSGHFCGVQSSKHKRQILMPAKTSRIPLESDFRHSCCRTFAKVVEPGNHVCRIHADRGSNFLHCQDGVPIGRKYAELRSLLEYQVRLDSADMSVKYWLENKNLCSCECLCAHACTPQIVRKIFLFIETG